MPSLKLFDIQTEEYRQTVFPPSVRLRLAVQAGAIQGWHRYTGDQGELIGLDHFGASLMREYGWRTHLRAGSTPKGYHTEWEKVEWRSR
jgi:transketolase